LRLLEGFHLRPTGFLSADHIHIVTECAKLTFADREAWYADPDFAKMPIADLLSRDHAAGRRELVAKRASLELRPAAPDEPEPRLPRSVAQTIAQGRWTGAGAQAIGVVRGDTVHVAVADKHGNVVACTSSGGWLQSSPMIGSLSLCLGIRAQMLNLDPDPPNRLEGGKRPTTTLTLSLSLRDGETRRAFRTRERQQDQWSLKSFLAHTVFGQDLQAAIDAPMFNTSHFPSSFAPHDAFPERLHVEVPPRSAGYRRMRRRGHGVVEEDPWSLGRLCAVVATPRLACSSPGPTRGASRLCGRPVTYRFVAI
jgi:gamma-glutamyltranspeptidase/glutathione hydrolase